ncbi:MAG: preprotein translocase subunit SecE [bacterium]
MASARQELRHINWPTRQEAARLTGIVIGIAAAFAIFLGFFDFIFTDIIRNVVLSGTRAPIESGTAPGAGHGAPAFIPEDIDIVTEEGTSIEHEGGVEIDIEPLNVQQ